jgi:hypothetical protein
VLVPYSKYAVVDCPFGSTVPLSLALVSRTLDADVVATPGAAEAVNV